jgi:hypothetical protein
MYCAHLSGKVPNGDLQGRESCESVSLNNIEDNLGDFKRNAL